jgi:dihydropteroate synthase
VSASRVIFDPGIGFGKSVDHNLELLRRLPELAALGRPLMIGASRKSFIGKVLGTDAMESRSWPTVAMTSFCRERGARVFRVHEVKASVEALRMTEAILGS